MDKIKSRIYENNIALHMAVVVSLTIGLAIISQFEVYITVVPLTFQTFYVTLTSLLCSRKTTVQYLSLYLILAVLGLPVLSGLQGLNPVSFISFGFVIGFIPMGYYLSYLSEKKFYKNFNKVLLNILIANIIVYFFGVTWVVILTNSVPTFVLLPYILFDCFKMFIVIISFNWITANNKM